MKYVPIKSMAWIAAMVSTSISAQTMVQDDMVDQAEPFTITKTNAQGEEVSVNKDFTGTYYLNMTASGANHIDSNYDYSYVSQGCFHFDTAGFLETNVYLPDGHRINGIRFFYNDGGAGSSRLELYTASGSGNFTSLHSMDSTGDAGTYTSRYENLPTPHFVNNAQNAYVVRYRSTTTSTEQQMCGVRFNVTATP